MAGYSRFESEICRADGENVDDILVVVIEGEDHVVANALLQSSMEIARVGNLEIRVNGNGNQASLAVDADYRGEIPERIPAPVVGGNRWKVGGIRSREIGDGRVRGC